RRGGLLPAVGRSQPAAGLADVLRVYAALRDAAAVRARLAVVRAQAELEWARRPRRHGFSPGLPGLDTRAWRRVRLVSVSVRRCGRARLPTRTSEHRRIGAGLPRARGDAGRHRSCARAARRLHDITPARSRERWGSQRTAGGLLCFDLHGWGVDHEAMPGVLVIEIAEHDDSDGQHGNEQGLGVHWWAPGGTLWGLPGSTSWPQRRATRKRPEPDGKQSNVG